jgi:S-(hydroxymethyl)glutathione dehydrogenase/alcohol dehydrogenase
MALNQLKPSSDSSMVVLGLCGIGLSALIPDYTLSHWRHNDNCYGFFRIILEMAKRLEATHVFNSGREGFRKDVPDLTQGGGDNCVETGGQVSTIELGFSLIRKHGGKLLFVSHTF